MRTARRSSPRSERAFLRAAVVALTASLLLALLPLSDASPMAAPAAEAQTSCPAPGGANQGFPLPSNASQFDVVLSGGGWGHGVGMSQYGAQGAASLGCSYWDIIGTYYPGARILTNSAWSPSTVRVGMTDVRRQNAGGITATVRTGSSRSGAPVGEVTWEFSGCAGGLCATRKQPAGVSWTTRVESGRLVVRQGSTEIYRAPVGAHARVRHDGKVVTVEVPGLRREFVRGYTRLHPTGSQNRMFVVQHVTSRNGDSGMERYLWGLAEVPTSWHLQALKAQVIAARTYAAKRVGSTRNAQCSCDLYATTADQHYTGWEHEREALPAWKTAVNDTAGQAITYGGRLIDAFYSSSHGGSSEAAEHVWGSSVPYLRAVDTSRWERAANNPRWRWTRGFTVTDLQNRLGVHRFVSLTVVRRGPGGRPTVLGRPDGVRVQYRDSGGVLREKWYSGEGIRWALGLDSALFHVVKGPGVAPPAEPVDVRSTTPACPPDHVERASFTDVPADHVHAAAIDCIATLWGIAEGRSDGTYRPEGGLGRGQMAALIARALEEAGVALPPAPAQPPFPDIAGTTHERAISRLHEAGLVGGFPDGTYRPGERVTRAQMATFLVGAYERATNAAMPLPASPTRYFHDISRSPHRDAINRVAEAGIAAGLDVGRYGPSRHVTRAQMASFLARMLAGLVDEGVTSPPTA